jgi:hypothetical protein
MKGYIEVGDPVKDSPMGAGVVTEITGAGFPKVNHVAVAWLRTEHDELFDPHNVSPKPFKEPAHQE